MECKNCPYGKEDYERSMSFYEKTIEERGIPNDIYDYLKPQDASEEFEQFIWCDKVGGKVYCFGHCEDAYSEEVTKKYISKARKRNKRKRDIKYKQHLKRLAEIDSGYPPSAYYVDEIWVKGKGYIKNPKPYYKRVYRGQRSKYYKRLSNKKIRRYKGELKDGRYCNKLYDFWWEYC